MALRNLRRVVLFDIDGTLTLPRKSATSEIYELLQQLRQRAIVGVVGGSDLVKQKEQLGENIINEVDYSFSENGLVAYKDGQIIATKTITDHLGEDALKEFINWTLRYLSEVDIPIKRGTFIEFRTGMINISPIGRNCSRAERDAFEEYDKQYNIRQQMIQAMQQRFAHLNLTYSIGGQISFDVFPNGWNKTYCLQYLPEEEYDEIHFFGDKTFEGGNDFEIYTHPRVIGHSVTSPEDTIRICRELFLS